MDTPTPSINVSFSERLKARIQRAYIYAHEKITSMSLHLSELLQRATSHGNKSNVIKPLIGIMALLLVPTLILIRYEAYTFAYLTIGMVMLTFLALLFSYFYCLIKNPDLLRSEKYNLEKTAIEKVSFLGDSAVSGKVVPPAMDYVLVESVKGSKEKSEE